MPKSCVIIGCGSHASAIISIVESLSDEYEITGLIDTAEVFDPTEEKSGYKVVLSLGELLSSSEKYDHLYCILAIGDNSERQDLFNKLLAKGFKLPNVISRGAFVDRTVKMGDGNIIAHGATVNAQVTLGSNNLINTGAIIEHHSVLENHIHIAPSATLCGSVNVADSSFIGAGAVIVPNVHVAQYSIVGAGSVLVTNIVEERSVFFGVPAKVRKK